MTRFFTPPMAIPWRYLGRSALRIVVVKTAEGMMLAGKGLYLGGVWLKEYGEEKLGK